MLQITVSITQIVNIVNKYFQIDNLRFEIVMTLFLYGAILRERASEVLPSGWECSLTIIIVVFVFYYHHRCNNFSLPCYRRFAICDPFQRSCWGLSLSCSWGPSFSTAFSPCGKATRSCPICVHCHKPYLFGWGPGQSFGSHSLERAVFSL